MKRLNKFRWMGVLLVMLCMTVPVQQTYAQAGEVAQAIKEGVKKVIKAIDLKIQRMQNKTIWLQNAQKTLENTMSKLKLDEIASWVEKQRNLYKKYYEGLAKVKSIIAYYHRIRDISQKQVRLLKEYHRAWNLFKQDKHFTSNELAYMAEVYGGILDESAKNIDQLFLVINSFKTEMTDAKRLEIINTVADRVDANYYDLTKFNGQSTMLSLQRAKDDNDMNVIKKLYGIE